MSEQERIEELVEQLDRNLIDRREMLRRASALGVSAAAVAAALTRFDTAGAQEGSANGSQEAEAAEEATMTDQQDQDAGTSMLSRLSDDLASAVERVGGSVVTVNARRRLPATGIVWTTGGLIVTANHVVERDDEITVGLPDGRELPATLVGRDPGTDLALLQVQADGLTAAPRGAAPARIGHFVLAVGRPARPGRWPPTASSPSSAAPWRTPQGAFDGYIRADVAMLPGFSGGPLVDARGNILGLNSSGFGRGAGLTVPVAAIERAVEALQAHGRIRRGFLGIGAQSVRLPTALVQAHNLVREQGLLIVSVEPDGPAERDGLMLGDVIVALAGEPVAEVEELQGRLSGDWVGRQLPVRIVRAGAPQELTVTVGERA
jgi:S1-C subfamily serine protease